MRYRIGSLFLMVLFMCALMGVHDVNAQDDMKFTRYQGKVTEVGKDRYIVSSRTVELQDITSDGKRSATEIYSVRGDRIRPQDVRKGDVLFVLGQLMPNGNILANTIYLQAHE
jgi:hypothetical protein